MPIRQKRLEPLAQRVGRWADALSGRRWVKTQRVYRVETGDLRLKRIALTDAARADALERALSPWRGRGILPDLVARHHADLWVEFVEGRPVTPSEADLPQRFADLLAVLYGAPRQRLDDPERRCVAEVERDLGLLARARVISAPLRAAVSAQLHARPPERLWVGPDHTDMLLKNMLRRPDGGLCLIDVESIAERELVGTGFAKACLRWIGPRREEFIEALRAVPGLPGFCAELPFLELRFLAAWSKRSLLLGKDKLLQAGHFEDWLTRQSAAGAGG